MRGVDKNKTRAVTRCPRRDTSCVLDGRRAFTISGATQNQASYFKASLHPPTPASPTTKFMASPCNPDDVNQHVRGPSPSPTESIRVCLCGLVRPGTNPAAVTRHAMYRH